MSFSQLDRLLLVLEKMAQASDSSNQKLYDLHEKKSKDIQSIHDRAAADQRDPHAQAAADLRSSKNAQEDLYKKFAERLRSWSVHLDANITILGEYRQYRRESRSLRLSACTRDCSFSEHDEDDSTDDSTKTEASLRDDSDPVVVTSTPARQPRPMRLLETPIPGPARAPPSSNALSQ